jgi:hypothetical protein
VIDSLRLTAKEWAAFVPPELEPATTWSVPDGVARRLCRVLIPSSDQSSMPRPEDAKLARLTGTVKAIEDGIARIRLAGAWDAVHLQEDDANRPLRGAATAEGEALYDLNKQAIQSLLLVFRGHYGHPHEDAVCAAGAVVEWHREMNASE